jgi:hypothetical protein
MDDTFANIAVGNISEGTVLEAGMHEELILE